MADQFDMRPYVTAMIQFGPSIVLGNQWISLGSIERIMQDENGLILIFKGGTGGYSCTEEESRQFHQAMVVGAKQIESQIQQQQTMQAQQAGRALGIIRPN